MAKYYLREADNWGGDKASRRKMFGDETMQSNMEDYFMLDSNRLLIPLFSSMIIFGVGIALVKLLFIFLQRRYNFEPINTLSISGILIFGLFLGVYGILVFFRPSLFEYRPTEWELKWKMNKVLSSELDKLDQIKDIRARCIRYIELTAAREVLLESDEPLISIEPSRGESHVMTFSSSRLSGDQEVSQMYEKFLQLKYPSWHKHNKDNGSEAEKSPTTFNN
jgi:hypothetical protein